MTMVHNTATSVFHSFFTDPTTTEIYTLSLHDALPIFDEPGARAVAGQGDEDVLRPDTLLHGDLGDRKSTRLNSSHTVISYAVFCLKKKKQTKKQQNNQKEIAKTQNETHEESDCMHTAT